MPPFGLACGLAGADGAGATIGATCIGGVDDVGVATGCAGGEGAETAGSGAGGGEGGSGAGAEVVAAM